MWRSGDRPRAQPRQQAVPLALADEDRGEVADRRGLDQRQGFEQLVERAEPARADDERAGVAAQT